MRKSSLFADKNRVGKGDWDRGRKESMKRRRDAIARIFGNKDWDDFQKNAGKTKTTYYLKGQSDKV